MLSALGRFGERQLLFLFSSTPAPLEQGDAWLAGIDDHRVNTFTHSRLYTPPPRVELVFAVGFFVFIMNATSETSVWFEAGRRLDRKD